MRFLALLSLLVLSACTFTFQVPVQTVNAKKELDIGQLHKSVGSVYVKVSEKK